MEVEINDKERTALSIFLGLRQKFAREMKQEDLFYTPKDLYRLFSELLQKINKKELDIHLICKEVEQFKEEDVWAVVEDKIRKSKILRYEWDKIFGRSLTQEILTLKKEGKSVKECFEILSKDERILKYLEKVKKKEKVLKNLKTSVCARYIESKTEEKILFGND